MAINPVKVSRVISLVLCYITFGVLLVLFPLTTLYEKYDEYCFPTVPGPSPGQINEDLLPSAPTTSSLTISPAPAAVPPSAISPSVGLYRVLAERAILVTVAESYNLILGTFVHYGSSIVIVGNILRESAIVCGLSRNIIVALLIGLIRCVMKCVLDVLLAYLILIIGEAYLNSEFDIYFWWAFCLHLLPLANIVCNNELFSIFDALSVLTAEGAYQYCKVHHNEAQHETILKIIALEVSLKQLHLWWNKWLMNAKEEGQDNPPPLEDASLTNVEVVQ